MKVIGVGLPKTGTTTLKKALEILGVEHDVGDHVHLKDSYDKADAYILTVRKDSTTWYNSVLRWDKVVGNRPKIQRQRLKMYGSIKPNKDWVKIYENHNAVWRSVPNCHILCWENGDSWIELCEILGCEVPEVPFPHANENTKHKAA